MAFRATFIGIDKHQAPTIPELSAARRDATALWALFADSIPEMTATLVTDNDATTARVKELLEVSLLQAEPEDVVVVGFAGHGTRDHRLVLFDTDPLKLPETTIPMALLGEYFRRSPARAVLCFIDCCFSGHAPARVFEDSPALRDAGDPFSSVAGKGRILIAASNPTEPALEMAGHGLLTEALLHVLKAGPHPIDVVGAMAHVMERVRTNAARLGHTQTPALYGHVEGGLVLPKLQPGQEYARAFPEVAGVRVTSHLQDLRAFGIPEPVLHEWQARFRSGLNDLQLAAINDHRILEGRSLLVIAPTSSGKTFVGELAAVCAHLDGRKSVFLFPYRALVNEKFDQFADLYGSALGLRVIRSTGDYLDDNRRFVSGQYDLCVMTYEMFLRLAVGSPHVLDQLGLIVLDEAQFMTDPRRGIVVELLLTLILSARDRGVAPQLVALSAVIGEANGFHEWLGCDVLLTTQRPVPLREGVFDRSGVFEFLDESAEQKTEQFLPPGAIVQRRDKQSAQDMIVPLVRRLVGEGQKVIVFRNAKGSAEGCAEYLARELNLSPATAVIEQLPTHDPSGSSVRLTNALRGGSAFHNANLRREERLAVERAFREPDGPVRVLAATTTVAAGINTPASTVILAEQEFHGEDGRIFTVAEYKNMAGRAGRLGFNEKGTSMILADAEHPRGILFRRYVMGVPDGMRSSFAENDVSTWVLRLLAQVRTIARTQVPAMLARTYAGYLLAKTDPGWSSRTRIQIEALLQRMLELGLLDEEGGNVRLSLLGQACGRSALSFDSAMRLVQLLRGARSERITAVSLIALVQALPEADALSTPIVRGRRGEPEWIQRASSTFGNSVVGQLQAHADDMRAYQKRCKRACLLAEWIAGTPVQALEERFSKNAFAEVGYGTVVNIAEGTRFWLGSAADILPLVLVGNAPDPEALDAILRRLEIGLPEALLDLLNVPIQLSRGECLTLQGSGITTADQFWATSQARLEELLTPSRVAQAFRAGP